MWRRSWTHRTGPLAQDAIRRSDRRSPARASANSKMSGDCNQPLATVLMEAECPVESGGRDSIRQRKGQRSPVK